MRRGVAGLVVVLLLTAGCTGEAPVVEPTPLPDAASPSAAKSATAPPEYVRDPPPPPPPRRPPTGTRRPAWLGKRVLPRTAAGYGEIRPTPWVLRRRRFPTVDVLPAPASEAFAGTISRVPDSVLARSTWSTDCPVSRGDLRYLTVSFVGFDGQAHTGELLVHAGAARDVRRAFKALYRARYPIEEMRVVDAPELDVPPTGDGNNTTAFVCRPSRGSTNWSQHAYGLAIDVNPFFNPYVRDDVVLPEFASYFTNRNRNHPGLLTPGGPGVRAFTRIEWEWGGDWSGLKDYMHFSANGR